jgi:hypothetical protein
MKMQSKPVTPAPTPVTGIWSIGIGTMVFSGWLDTQPSKETDILENLILTFGRLGFTKCYYEDFKCSDRDDFLRKLKTIAYDLIIAKRQRHKKIQKPDWKIQYDNWQANLLAITDHHCRSRQSIQALMLAEKRSTYLRPSSFLIDSS